MKPSSRKPSDNEPEFTHRNVDGRDANRTSPVVRPGSFIPFDEDQAVRIYRRNLPHWRQQGCTYFVTFRFADSIPGGVRRQWEHEQLVWLHARGIQCDGPHGAWRNELDKRPTAVRFRFEKHFNQQVQACLDRGLGACWLKRHECVLRLSEQMFRADGERHHLGDFVIMPNHVHALLTPIVGNELESILKAIKGKAAIECNKHLGRSGQVWQPESYDHIVRDLDQLRFYRRYIADNPQRAGITVSAEALYRAAWMDQWLPPVAM